MVTVYLDQRVVPVWPAPLLSWLPEKWRTHRRIPALEPRCQRNEGLLSEIPLQIIGLDPETLKASSDYNRATAAQISGSRRAAPVVLVFER